MARPPQRIVSLVPSDTETLFALGVGDRVVGRTRYCVEPADQVDDIPTCGGTKDIDVAAVQALAPDLILANQEENTRPALEALAKTSAILFVSFPCRVAEGVAHAARLARLLGVTKEPAVRDLIRRGHLAVSDAQAGLPAGAGDGASDGADDGARAPLDVFLPIWKQPLMTLNGDTYGSDMLAMAGARNIFSDRRRRYPLAADLGNLKLGDAAGPDSAGDGDGDGGRDTRYPRVSLDEVRDRAPSVVLLPDEPYEFDDADADWCARELGLDRGRVVRVDGRDLFWHGARTVEALPRLRALIDSLRDQ